MHTEKEIDRFLMKYKEILYFQGEVDDEIFSFLVKNISKNNKDDVQNLIYIVNKKEHIDELVNEYGLNFKKVHHLEKKWQTEYTVEHLESLNNYNCVSLKKIFTHIISKENKKKLNNKIVEDKNSEAFDFVIKNIKMDAENLGLINPINYLEKIKSNRSDFKDFIIYFSRSVSENHFSEDTYDENVFIDFFDIIGKEKFLELYNNERFFKSENIIMLIENNRLEIKDLNYLRSESLNSKIKMKDSSFYPAYYQLFNDLKNEIVIDKNMKFNKDIDLSLLNKDVMILFNILRNKHYEEVAIFIKAFYNTSNEKINISTDNENLFSILTSTMSHNLSFNLRKMDIQEKNSELANIENVFNDLLQFYPQKNADVFFRNKDKDNFIDKTTNYDLLEIMLNSKIMLSSDYNELKVSIWNKINTEDNIRYMFLREKFVKKEKELILNNLNPMGTEKNLLKKRI